MHDEHARLRALRCQLSRRVDAKWILLGIVVLVGVGLFILVVSSIGFSWAALGEAVQHVYGPADTQASLVADVRSKDFNRICDGFEKLRRRLDPIAQVDALRLLESENPYLWLNAALYLGAINDEASVPYLIKALRHPASRAGPDAVAALRSMTGQPWGLVFDQWRQWWLKENPESTFDFDSYMGRIGLRGTVTILFGTLFACSVRRCRHLDFGGLVWSFWGRGAEGRSRFEWARAQHRPPARPRGNGRSRLRLEFFDVSQ